MNSSFPLLLLIFSPPPFLIHHVPEISIPLSLYIYLIHGHWSSVSAAFPDALVLLLTRPLFSTLRCAGPGPQTKNQFINSKAPTVLITEFDSQVSLVSRCFSPFRSSIERDTEKTHHTITVSGPCAMYQKINRQIDREDRERTSNCLRLAVDENTQ